MIHGHMHHWEQQRRGAWRCARCGAERSVCLLPHRNGDRSLTKKRRGRPPVRDLSRAEIDAQFEAAKARLRWERNAGQ